MFEVVPVAIVAVPSPPRGVIKRNFGPGEHEVGHPRRVGSYFGGMSACGILFCPILDIVSALEAGSSAFV